MLSWSIIAMQRDETCSQTAQSAKRLIFQSPVIKNHRGSDWVTIAGSADSPSCLLFIVRPPKTDHTGNRCRIVP